MDDKRMKLFVIKQSKGCKFVPKMHQNTRGGRAPPGPAGGTYALPGPIGPIATTGTYLEEGGRGRRKVAKGRKGIKQ